MLIERIREIMKPWAQLNSMPHALEEQLEVSKRYGNSA
jgi:hypothetical protein